MAVTVRRATRGDATRIAEFATALAALHAELDHERFTPFAGGERAVRFYGDRAEAESAAVFVAEGDERVVGFAYLEYEPVLYRELATKVAWLDDIYVEPDARGQGAGRKLLDAVKTEARRLGANKILLSVADKNAAGRQLFVQNGFRTTMHEMMFVVDE